MEGLTFSRDEETDHLRAIFEEVTNNQRLSGEFRVITAQHHSAQDIVVARARAADLVVASQADSDWRLSSLLDCSEQLAIECGRPVMIIPNAGKSRALPRKAIIAWNQSREATRAMYEAVPLLKGARTIELLTLDVPRIGEALTDQAEEIVLPASAVAQSLAEHGIHLTITTLKATAASVGDQICARANEEQADLVVMGAYGHSRLREFVFGGATRHVLTHMPVPTLFSH